MTRPQAPDDVAAPVVRTSFPATPDDITRQLVALRPIFRNHGLQDDLHDTVAIVLGEVLNNIAEHAVTTGEDEIRLDMRHVSDRLHVKTEDRGHALPSRLLGVVNLPEMGQSVDDLPEGGFGWFIIHALVDDMVYEREDGTNRLTFSFSAPRDR